MIASALVLVDSSPGSAKASAAAAQGIVTVAGNAAQSGPLATAVPSTSVALGSPVGIATDSQGNVVIADQDNNVVRVATTTTGTFYGQAMSAGRIYTIVGNGTAGDGPWGTLPPLLPTQTALNDPNGVAVDAQGDIAITDTGNNAVRLLAGASGTRYGMSMTKGQFYTIAGEGGSLFNGESATSAGLSSPDGVAFDAQGDVVIADTGNDVVRFLPQESGTFFGRAMQAGYIYTIAGNAVYGYTGNGGPATSAEISIEPFAGVAVDSSDDVAIADADNNVIRLVAGSNHIYDGMALKTGVIYTIAGSGHQGYSGNKKVATKAALDTPQGVAFDAGGNLLLADSNNNVIRLVAAGNGSYGGMALKVGKIYTIAGNGKAGYSGDGGRATAADLNAPAGLSVNPSGLVEIADNGNNVVRATTTSVTAVPTVATVAAVKPASGLTSGGTKVTITGTNLSGATSVTFGSQPAEVYAVKTAKKIVAYAPLSTPGTVTIVVKTSAGTSIALPGDSYTFRVAASRTKHRRAQAAL